MQSESPPQPVIEATVREVLPKLGLAYLVDNMNQTWGVTRSTPGTGIDTLRVGERVRLQLHHFKHYSLVQRYSKLC